MPATHSRDPVDKWVLRSLIPGPDCRHRHHEWNRATARRARYRLRWALCDGFAYDGPDGDAIRRELGLYRHARPIANPFSRIVEFQVAHLMGGRLDPAAGDGKLKPSALPIDPGVGESMELPAAIAALWRASSWHRRKSLLSRFGAKYGDPAIELVDDPKSRKIKMRVVDPNEIEDATVDYDGQVVSYVLERHEADPHGVDGATCIYREEVGRDDPDGPVIYRTFKDGSPYHWPGTPGPEWKSELPFVPLVLGQHIDLGFPWGIAEHDAAIRKGVERDDQASNLSDANRRMVNGPWVLTGASIGGSRPGDPLILPGSPRWNDPINPQANARPAYQYRKIEVGSRDEMPFLTCDNPAADIKPLVYPVPVAAVAAFIQAIGDNQNQDYPELQIDGLAGLSSSGEARREAKKNAAQKIVERRAIYDDMIVRAHKMGIIMGAALGYEDFSAFRGVEDLDDARIDHSIADRPVFSMDDMERAELQKVRAEAIKGYRDSGFSLEAACYQVDMTEQDIDDILEMNEAADEKSAKAEQDAMARMTGEGEEVDGSIPPPPLGNQTDAVTADTADIATGTATEG